jgi:hypothetical protein
MINKDIKKIESQLGYVLKRSTFVLAFDTATTTGVAKLITTNNKLSLDTFCLKIPAIPKDTENKSESYEEALNALLLMIRDFKQTLPKKKQKSILVLENSYLGFNAYTYGYLKGFMGLLYAELYDYFESIKIIFPTSARKQAGFKSSLPKGSKREEKKQEIINWINQKFDLELKDDNQAEALILGLCGLKE